MSIKGNLMSLSRLKLAEIHNACKTSVQVLINVQATLRHAIDTNLKILKIDGFFRYSQVGSQLNILGFHLFLVIYAYKNAWIKFNAFNKKCAIWPFLCAKD